MSTRKLAVVTAGLSDPSSSRLLADRLTAATTTASKSAGIDVEVTVIELRDLAQEITNNLLTGFASGNLRAALDQVAAADGVIAVTPIFSASYSGLFKSFFDVLEPDSLTDTPVLIGATGGTERHSLALDHALRPLFNYLRATVVPTGVYAASSDWGTQGSGLSARIDRAGHQLAQLIKESERTTNDAYDQVTPFAQLLG